MDQSEEERRILEDCKAYQQEWPQIHDLLYMIPGHERRIRDIETRLVLMDEIPRMISETVERTVKTAVSDAQEEIKQDIRDIRINQKEIRREQETFIKAKQTFTKIVLAFALIGIITVTFVVGKLSSDELKAIATGVSTRKP